MSKKGYTLVELLIVIAVIAILITIVLIAINPIKVINDSNDTKTRTEMNQLKAALQLYFNDKGRYPTAAEFSASGGANDLRPTYTKNLPKGAGGSAVTYGVNAGGDDYDVGASLNNPSTEGDDGGTKTSCSTPSLLITAGSLDYFICPD